MFQFRRFPHCTYFEFQCSVPEYEPRWVSSFRDPRINAYLQLPEAYRSLSRLSSAPSAKAFALRPCSLDHSNYSLSRMACISSWFSLANEDYVTLPLKLQYFLKRTTYNLCFAVIIQFSRYVFEFPFQGPQNRTISTSLLTDHLFQKAADLWPASSCLTP